MWCALNRMHSPLHHGSEVTYIINTTCTRVQSFQPSLADQPLSTNKIEREREEKRTVQTGAVWDVTIISLTRADIIDLEPHFTQHDH